MTADTVDASSMTEHSNLPFDSFESIRDFIRFSFSNTLLLTMSMMLST
jgi:hypothetical protein